MNQNTNNLAEAARSNEPDEPGELDWLAFQYVAGELSPAEAVAFEERLACDRHACEALARMMQTVDALAVAVPARTSLRPRTVLQPRTATPLEPVRGVPSSPVRVRALVGLITAACVMAVAVFVSQPAPLSRNVETVSRGDRASEIVSLWADTAGEADAENERLDRAILGEDSDLSVPGWMISAVEYAAKEGEPEMEEN